MNGLKTVWIISRHYRGEDRMEKLITLISDEIAEKVETNIKISELFKMNSYPYDVFLQSSIDRIK